MELSFASLHSSIGQALPWWVAPGFALLHPPYSLVGRDFSRNLGYDTWCPGSMRRGDEREPKARARKLPGMSPVASGSLVRQLGSLFEGGSVAGLSDRQLIERFLTRRDAAGEAAFAALVARHGPMVLDVCRQLLGDRHHAEDAFQAVFLVLARKAGSIRDPDLLGNWLYGVALRTARKAEGPARPPAPGRGRMPP